MLSISYCASTIIKDMVDILLTNDDGYQSIGFISLLKELSKEFSVLAITSPDGKSWTGKAITAKREMDLKKVKIDGFDILVLNGTPADCVQVGIYNILKKLPRMVVSGINDGPNIGRGRILSSGTVGAAMEASIIGIKAIASSFCLFSDVYRKPVKKINFIDSKNCPILKNAAEITFKLVKTLIKKDFSKDVDLFSINIPFNATINSDFEITKLFKDTDWKLFHKKNNKFIHHTPFLKIKASPSPFNLIFNRPISSITFISVFKITKF